MVAHRRILLDAVSQRRWYRVSPLIVGCHGMIAGKIFNVTLKVLGNFSSSRECPLCGWTGFQFLPSAKGGDLLRFDARCPRCSSLERHRLAYVMLNSELPESLGRVLHFSPEKLIRSWLETKAIDYQTADYAPGAAMHQVDIQKMQFGDASFDFIWCSHVLEHVPNDRAAISEIGRVLSPGGLAVVQVPVWGFETVEGELPLAERIRVYYQDDHVRRYGSDIVKRLSNAADLSLTVRSTQELELQTALRFGLLDMPGDELFVLTKTL